MIGLLAANYKFAYKEYPPAIDDDKFEQFLSGETLNDTWGTMVRYERTDEGYIVISAGPDKKYDTLDDLQLTSSEIENWSQ